MIHYHGMPMSSKVNVAKVMSGRHALVSFKTPGYLDVVAEVCSSYILDNGAFTYWTSGGNKEDWADYYEWVREWRYHPGFDWAIIPDVIDGTEEENDALLAEWPFSELGAPVWHIHESLGRLCRLACDWPRICFGSSGQFATIGTVEWWERMREAIAAISDGSGRPVCKLHGLRMLNPAVFTKLPLASADSCNAGRNCGTERKKHDVPQDFGAEIIMRRIEIHNSAPCMNGQFADPADSRQE